MKKLLSMLVIFGLLSITVGCGTATTGGIKKDEAKKDETKKKDDTKKDDTKKDDTKKKDS